jgi:hypothetical protein
LHFQIDVEPLIDHLVERARNEDDRQSDGIKTQLDDALTRRHETEAKLVQAEAQIAQLQEVIK